MQSESEQVRGRVEEARGAVNELRGRAEQMLGRAQANVGEMQSRVREVPSSGAMGGVIAFGVAVVVAMLVLFPSTRTRLWEGAERYTGRRRERPIDRVRRWSRQATDSLSRNW